jgi:hypothetical protein
MAVRICLRHISDSKDRQFFPVFEDVQAKRRIGPDATAAGDEGRH